MGSLFSWQMLCSFLVGILGVPFQLADIVPFFSWQIISSFPVGKSVFILGWNILCPLFQLVDCSPFQFGLVDLVSLFGWQIMCPFQFGRLYLFSRIHSLLFNTFVRSSFLNHYVPVMPVTWCNMAFVASNIFLFH